MLTPSAVKNAKDRAKPYKLNDERGLYLLVRPNGSRWWRFKYRRPGTRKENLLSLGTFPDVSLKRAREKRDDARRLLADGIDPSAKRKIEAVAAADTFEAIAREWYAKNASQWVPAHGDRIIRRLERDVFPWIGAHPVSSLSAPDVLGVLRRIESRTAIETAHRALQNCGQVLRYAVATGRATADVTRDLRGALQPITKRHFAAITDPERLGDLLCAIDGYHGTLPVCAALKLAPLVFVRPGELRKAEWSEFDLDAAEWNIPPQRRKLKKALKGDPTTPPHCVPLATQAVAILRELQPLTGDGRFVFPGVRDRRNRPMSDAALTSALRRLGYDSNAMTPHGFRAIARTILDERLGFRPDFIEHQLGHSVRDPNGRAYNRTRHLDERRKMMQAWGDYLDDLRSVSKRQHSVDDGNGSSTHPNAKNARAAVGATNDMNLVEPGAPDNGEPTDVMLETPEDAVESAIEEMEQVFAAAALKDADPSDVLDRCVPLDRRILDLVHMFATNDNFKAIDADSVAKRTRNISVTEVAKYFKVTPDKENGEAGALVGLVIGCAYCAASLRAHENGNERLAWMYAVDATRITARLWSGFFRNSYDRHKLASAGGRGLHKPDYEAEKTTVEAYRSGNFPSKNAAATKLGTLVHRAPRVARRYLNNVAKLSSDMDTRADIAPKSTHSAKQSV